MVNEEPKYIERDELQELISEQAGLLPAPEAGWWQEHRVELFTARCAELQHYVVARSGGDIIFFAEMKTNLVLAL